LLLSLYLEKKKAALVVLKDWKHINCLATSARDLVQDDILYQILHADDSVSSTAQEMGQKSKSLLSSIDLEQISATTTTKSVPGGRITFVFEKTSSKSDEDVE
jgi:DNA repair and recombination protein RAD54B